MYIASVSEGMSMMSAHTRDNLCEKNDVLHKIYFLSDVRKTDTLTFSDVVV